jgi:hypothetical protein
MNTQIRQPPALPTPRRKPPYRKTCRSDRGRYCYARRPAVHVRAGARVRRAGGSASARLWYDSRARVTYLAGL